MRTVAWPFVNHRSLGLTWDLPSLNGGKTEVVIIIRTGLRVARQPTHQPMRHLAELASDWLSRFGAKLHAPEAPSCEG